MKVELRKNSDGKSYYSFVYYDQATKKPKRISQQDIRKRFGKSIIDYENALDACKLLEAEIDSLKHRIEKRISWENEFYDFNKLLGFYELQQRKKAPNSYENNIHYLKYYVLPFFLSVKKCNNISMWFDFYQEFKDWLEDKARLIQKPEQNISYASKNHAINALNTFMNSLHRLGFIDRYYKCDSFPSYKLNERGISDVIKIEEMEALYHSLRKEGHIIEAIFFRFLFFTGMRFNEALGVHPGNLYDGEIEDQVLKKHLIKERLKYFGYVVIDSQPSNERKGLRNKNGKIFRKPLKGRKKIDDKSARTIIIIDKILWNELVRLHNEKLAQLDNGYFGKEVDQYPLFESINKSSSARRLKDAYKNCHLKYRSWHCCRHTRATMLIGETSNPLLARLWLGHSSEKVLNRYVHTYEAIVRSAKKNETDKNSSARRLKQVD